MSRYALKNSFRGLKEISNSSFGVVTDDEASYAEGAHAFSATVNEALARRRMQRPINRFDERATTKEASCRRSR
jgi:hypothetical protein